MVLIILKREMRFLNYHGNNPTSTTAILEDGSFDL